MILALLATAGCAADYVNISTVPPGYPADQVAVLHCSSPCLSISDQTGATVAKATGTNTEIELPAGTYDLNLRLCFSGTWPSSNLDVSVPITLSAGGSYYVDSHGSRARLVGCYSDLQICDHRDVEFGEDGKPGCNRFAIHKRASCGDPRSQFYLGLGQLFGATSGYGSPTTAYMWLLLASKGGLQKDTQPYIDRIRAEMVHIQKARGEQLAREWRPDTDGCA